ncbi:MAG: nitronate monooxygenase [Chloroflexota bacterium]|nr:nitronate monooxygenase [Chloroflexota bacterium]
MKKTRVCGLLDIEHPIIQGGMTWIANAELAAAVSQAGGLGTISPNAGMRLEDDVEANLRYQIRQAQDLTSRPFTVNIVVLIPEIAALIDVLIEEGVKVVTTAAGNPRLHTPRMKEAGLKVLHVVSSVRQAQVAEECGVDAVIAEGFEAGGHNGFDELPTMVLVPQIVDAVNIPVIAAGGIADARGLVAAFALGAEGVQMGTRFVATTECNAHRSYKDRIVESSDTGTVVTGRALSPTRTLKNEFAAGIAGMDRRGVTADELLAYIGMGRSRMGQIDGEVEEGELYAGAISGLIGDIAGAGDIVRGLVEGYDAIVSRLK